MDAPKDQMALLLENGLYDSAQTLGCFFLSSSIANAEASVHGKAEILILQGDAFYGQKEFYRALSMYKQALQHCKIIPKQTSNSRSSLPTSTRSSSPNSMTLSTINENEVKFKITLCHCALNQNSAALAEMEGIPSKARTLQMNLTMGRLQRISGRKNAATLCYKDCLRHCPYILEAITALAELGVSSKEILSLFPQTLNRSGRPPSEHMDTTRWLQRYAEAQCCVASNDYPGGLDIFSELLQRFPNNVHVLLETAKVQAIIGRNDEATVNFEKVRCIDPYIMTYMDEYAMLLKAKCDHSKLNKLVHDLLNIDPTKAETYVALSIKWEKKDEKKAIAYAEKSVRIDDRHVLGYIMKGNLYLSLARSDSAAAAVTAFRMAQEQKPDIRSYQGLVRSYLALFRFDEALHVARKALKAMPQSAKVLKLVGDVYASNSSGREKARKYYESALRLEPGFLGAALALAELHVVEGRHRDAVSLLERYLKDWADDSLHIKLAQVFTATNMFSESLSHYQAALRINPQNDAAKKGLERLEKQMKGMDPDAAEDDEENDLDDAEGDQEEGEQL